MRTPTKNGLISLIPFYGLTSYFYLGWHYGLITLGLNIFIVTLSVLSPFLLYDLTSDDLILITSNMVSFLFLFVLQFVVVRYFTKKRNLVISK
jgi:hypothetical protein